MSGELPNWLEFQIQTEREIEALAGLLGKDLCDGKASDAEVCACLYYANLQAPMDYHSGQIYLYLATGLMKKRGVTVPEEIRVTELSGDQSHLLEEMRRTIYRKRGKAETPVSRAMKEVFGKPRKKAVGDV